MTRFAAATLICLIFVTPGAGAMTIVEFTVATGGVAVSDGVIVDLYFEFGDAGPRLFEGATISAANAGQTLTWTAMRTNDVNFDAAAEILTNGIDEILWLYFVNPQPGIVLLVGTGDWESDYFAPILSGSQVDLAGWFISSVTLTIPNITYQPPDGTGPGHINFDGPVVSFAGHPVPAPAPIALLVMAVAAVSTIRRRHTAEKRNPGTDVVSDLPVR